MERKYGLKYKVPARESSVENEPGQRSGRLRRHAYLHDHRVDETQASYLDDLESS